MAPTCRRLQRGAKSPTGMSFSLRGGGDLVATRTPKKPDLVQPVVGEQRETWIGPGTRPATALFQRGATPGVITTASGYNGFNN